MCIRDRARTPQGWRLLRWKTRKSFGGMVLPSWRRQNGKGDLTGRRAGRGERVGATAGRVSERGYAGTPTPLLPCAPGAVGSAPRVTGSRQVGDSGLTHPSNRQISGSISPDLRFLPLRGSDSGRVASPRWTSAEMRSSL